MRKLLLPALILCGIIHVSGNAHAAPACSSFADGSGNFVITQDCTGTVTPTQRAAVTATQSGTSLLNSATLAGGVFAGNGIRFDVTNESGGIIRRNWSSIFDTLTLGAAVALFGGGTLTNSGAIGDGLHGIDSNGSVGIITSPSSPGVLTNNLGGTILGGAALTGDAATVVNRGTISYNIAGASSVGVGLYGANASLINSGLIVSGPVTSYGVTSGDFGGANYTNESGGRIEGSRTGLRLLNSGTLTNSGTIIGTGSSADSDGLHIFKGSVIVDNRSGGLIQGLGGSGIADIFQPGGLIRAPAGSGMSDFFQEQIMLTMLTLTNSGTIAGPIWGVRLQSPNPSTITNSGSITGGTGVEAPLITLTNSGTITGTNGPGLLLGGGTTITGPIYGVRLQSPNPSTITNSGSITGGTGVEALLITLTNSGTITGTSGSGLLLDRGTVTNSGTITSQTGIGVQFTGSSASQLTNSGTITPASGSAAVRMGSGNDTVTLQTGSVVNGNVDGGGGTDTLTLEGSGAFAHSLLNFENIQMPGPGSWSFTGGGGLSASTITMTNGGSISGGITAGGSSTLTLLSGGTIGAAGNGRAISLTAGAGAGPVTLTNSGTIGGEVHMSSSDSSASFTNMSGGAISSPIDGVRIGGSGPITFVNHGSIIGGNGVTGGNYFGGDAIARGVQLLSNNATATNTGTVRGRLEGFYMSAGSLTNSGTIISETGVAVRFTNVFDSQVTNSGTITPASGFAAILMGGGNDTVTLNAGSVVNGDINGGAGTDTLNVQAGVTFSHNYLNFEVLNIQAGSSSGGSAAPVQLAGLSGVASITVSSGSADLSSGTINSDVTVGTSGTLVGTGTINGDLTNSGMVGPGNSIGTISINGAFTNNPTGTEETELAPDGTSDRIAVTGTATLSGGTVNPVLLFGTTPFQTGTQYPILTATGGVTGQFATLNQPYLTTSYALSYEANRVLLTLTRNPFAGFGATSNQTAVGTYLDTLVTTATGDLAAVVNTLDALTQVADLRTAYEQLSPEPYDAYARQALALAGWLGGAVTGRLREARGDTRLPARAASLVAMNELILSDAAPASPSEEKGWSGWARALGGRGELGSSGDRTGFGYDAAGLMAGLDYRLSATTVVGLGAGYARTSLDLRDGRGEGDTDSHQIGLYATWHRDRLYLDAGAFYGFNQHDASRNITYPGLTRKASADFDSQQVTVLLGGGWLSPLGSWKLGPELSVLYSHLGQESFTETGAGDVSLRVDERRTDSLRSALGLLAQRTVKLEEGTVDLEARAAWVREHLEGGRDLKARFAGAGSGTFKVKAEEPVRDAIQVGVGAGFQVNPYTRLFAQYEGGFGRDGYRSHTGMFGLQVRF